MTYFTIEAIKRANRARGHYFFERDTMRFFRSRVLGGVIAGRFFITSEQFNDRSARLYSVREVNDDGSIDSTSEFQQFETARQARAWAKRIAGESFACAKCGRAYRYRDGKRTHVVAGEADEYAANRDHDPKEGAR